MPLPPARGKSCNGPCVYVQPAHKPLRFWLACFQSLDCRRLVLCKPLRLCPAYADAESINALKAMRGKGFWHCAHAGSVLFPNNPMNALARLPYPAARSPRIAPCGAQNEKAGAMSGMIGKTRQKPTLAALCQHLHCLDAWQPRSISAGARFFAASSQLDILQHRPACYLRIPYLTSCQRP